MPEFQQGEHMKKTLCMLALSAAISGCAGTSFKWDQARQVKEGMTEAEVTQLMGAPYLVKSGQDGMVWVWSHADAFAGSRSVSVVIKDGKVTKAPVIPESFK